MPDIMRSLSLFFSRCHIFPLNSVLLHTSNTMHKFPFLILLAGLLINGEPTISRYVVFVRNLFVGPKDLTYSTAVIFDRNQGEVNRESYKRAYGHQGEKLVGVYGKGLSKKQLEDMGYL